MSTILKKPLVSVIVLNWNGLQYLRDCYSSLMDLDFPMERLELILVDNGSTDGSAEFMRRTFPDVTVIAHDKNHGFAPPNNWAAQQASGRYLAFLNNDMSVRKSWLTELVNTIESDEKVGCVASRVLSWNGKSIDFAGGSVNFEGRGFQSGIGSKNLSRYRRDRDILFANGGAMLVDRQKFLDIGGFDEDYFAYYEDVDLGWRFWLYGHHVRYAHKSITYHRHSATSSRFPDWKKAFYLERNALATIFKNFGEEAFRAAMPASSLLGVNRFVLQAGVEPDAYDIEHQVRSSGVSEEVDIGISRHATAFVAAVREFNRNIEYWWEKRSRIQSERTVDDSQIFRLFHRRFEPILADPDYLQVYSRMVEMFNLEKVFTQGIRRRILIITHEPIAKNMAGPAIRAVEIARALSTEFETVLATTSWSDVEIPGVRICSYSVEEPATLLDEAEESDVLLVQGYALANIPELRETQKTLVVDLYCPFILENIEIHRSLQKDAETRAWIHTKDLEVLNDQLDLGDYFLCASDRQRDFWLGALLSRNRVNPASSDRDKTGDDLIGVVPFGIPGTPPEAPIPVLKGVYEGIEKRDRVILWGGSITDWFDPLTLIRAVGLLCEKHDNVKLFFMGVDMPNPEIPPIRMLDRSRELAEELHLVDRHVFFNSWVPYYDRSGYLLESDVGVTTHFRSLETRFSFRTRILDYIWASLPMVITEGDHFSELVKNVGLGLVVPPEDPKSLAQALEKLLFDAELQAEIRTHYDQVREDFYWEKAVEPLAHLCRRTRFAPELHSLHRSYPKVLPFRGAAGGRDSHRTLERKLVDRIEERIDLRDKLLETQYRQVKGMGSIIRKWDLLADRVHIDDLRRLARKSATGAEVEQEDGRRVLTDLRGQRTIGQHFTADLDELNGIAIRLATFDRVNTEDIILHLRSKQDGPDLRTVVLNGPDVKDTEYSNFMFPPVPDSRGKKYFFYLESPESHRWNAISAWAVDFGVSEKGCVENGKRVSGRLDFCALYADSN